MPSITSITRGDQEQLNILARRVREHLGDGFIVSTCPWYADASVLIEERYTGPNPFSNSTYSAFIDAAYLWDHFDLAMKFTKLKYGIWKLMRDIRLV